MSKKQELYLFYELLREEIKEDLYKNEISCFRLNSKDVSSMFFFPLYVDAYVYWMIDSGSTTLLINSKEYTISSHDFIVLSPLHILQFKKVSPDFSCFVLVVNKRFLDIIPSMEKVFKHLNRSLKLFNYPIFRLQPNEYSTLENALTLIQCRIGQVNHLFQIEIIQNAFINFLLEWINIYEHSVQKNQSDVDLNRSEQILQSFITLLKNNFKKEHHVSFYAYNLGLTPQYLNLIVKQLTGQTINQFVYEMIYNEASILLNQTKLSIQEISEELNFSDASSFCKFFKKRSGISPLKYRQA